MLCQFRNIKQRCDLAICKSVIRYKRVGNFYLSFHLSKSTNHLSKSTKERRTARQGVSLGVRAEPLQRAGKLSIMTTAGEMFFLDEFAIRQWDDPNYSGTRICYSKSDFVEKLHDLHAKVGRALTVKLPGNVHTILDCQSELVHIYRELSWYMAMRPSASMCLCPTLWAPNSERCQSQTATDTCSDVATAAGALKSYLCSRGGA
jgi:hypothetical protein